MAGNQRELSLVAELNALNNKVFNACTQVKIINQQMEMLSIRYTRAVQSEKPAFRYSIRLRLATYEDVRKCLLQYAVIKANQMDDLEEQILNERSP